jgi:hypothetical protein
VRYEKAGVFWTWFLTRYNLAGIVMPIPFLPTCYYLEPWNKCPEFVRHENVHYRQIQRMGTIKFTIAYLYYLARYGYRNNPLEIEAYGHEESRREEADDEACRKGQRFDAQGQEVRA